MSTAASEPESGPVLAGVKVWDASWVGVGPLTAKYLADYGALVVHTETASRPDVLRNGAAVPRRHPGHQPVAVLR